MEVQFLDEHLWPKHLGQFAIIFGFVMSLLAATAYFFATQRRNTEEFANWRKIGRVAFALHGLSVFTIIGSIFFAMANQYFEYQYVWTHVSSDLPMQYIFSAFWEGQEGSFLLWMFWHVVLGFILLFRAKEWETPVLSVLSMVQAFILTMILGVYISETTKIGSNPLLLLREVTPGPVFANANYMEVIRANNPVMGNGLNPLLQNYWMTIHPPTLFLGFASTVVPFCFAMAGLWTKEHKKWLQPALPWALFSGSILGIGILMGGAWAYEALSFGGYWAWDPVENMSLVPWLLLVAGIHTHLVARSAGYSTRSTYLFYLVSFLLVLYSTYLTRSGVLGESSVHAFTEMGLEAQLILFMAFFFGAGAILFLRRMGGIPEPKKEEAVSSKEFWMFIGSLVLLFSAVIITASTSLPVFNKIVEIWNPDFKGYTINKPIEHYNRYQLYIGVFIGILSGVAQFLRFREQNWKAQAAIFGKHTLIAAVGAALLTVLTSFWIKMGGWQFWLLAFTAFYTVVSNADYLFSFLKGNMKLAGSVVSHVGFGLMVVGTIASGLNKQNISNNEMVQKNLLDEEMVKKNILLFKGMPMYMSGYRVTYESDTMVGNLRKFLVNYERLNEKGEVQETFAVEPTATYDNKVVEVKAFNPATKRYIDKDIFTHIATLPLRESDFREARKMDDSLKYESFEFVQGNSVLILDTVQGNDGSSSLIETEAELLGITKLNATHPDYKPQEGDIAVGVKMAFHKKDTTFYAEPVMVVRDQMLYTYPVQINDLSMKVRLVEDALNRIYPLEDSLNYKPFTFKQGQQINYNGLTISLKNINKDPQHPAYKKQDGDLVAVGATMEVSDGKTSRTAEPLFLIRGNTPENLLDAVEEFGLYFRFLSINPQEETFTILIAQADKSQRGIPVQIAKKSFRTDYIVLEAIIFPGINLFWLGSVMMMLGLAVAMFRRRKEKQLIVQKEEPTFEGETALDEISKNV